MARGVTRYVWTRCIPTTFQTVQAVRGQRGGIASDAARLAFIEDKFASALLTAANGMSIHSIADKLGVGKSTVVR